uniref:PIR2-like helical domain-containing protein n=1 Tax=Setaria italica TaxID=4555 RepID=K3XPF6_SETIT
MTAKYPAALLAQVLAKLRGAEPLTARDVSEIGDLLTAPRQWPPYPPVRHRPTSSSPAVQMVSLVRAPTMTPCSSSRASGKRRASSPESRSPSCPAALQAPASSALSSSPDAGHCYGPMDPVSNIILSSVWYDAAFPHAEAAGLPDGILDTRPMPRMGLRSLAGLVAIVCDTGCCRSEHERRWSCAAKAAKHPQHAAFGSFLMSLSSEKLNRLRCLLTAAGGISDAHWDELNAILVEESESVPSYRAVSVEEQEVKCLKYSPLTCSGNAGSYSESKRRGLIRSPVEPKKNLDNPD